MIKQTVMMLSSILLAGSAFAAASAVPQPMPMPAGCPAVVPLESLRIMAQGREHKARIGAHEFTAQNWEELKNNLPKSAQLITKRNFEKNTVGQGGTEKGPSLVCNYAYKTAVGNWYHFTIQSYMMPGNENASPSQAPAHPSAAPAPHPAAHPSAPAPHGAPPPLPARRPSN